MVRWAERQRNVQTRFWTLQKRVVLRVLEVVGAWVQRITVFTGMPSTLTVSTPQGRFTSTVVSPRDGLVLWN